MGITWELRPASDFSLVSERWQNLLLSGAPIPVLESRFVAAAVSTLGERGDIVATAREGESVVAMGVFRRSSFWSWTTLQPSQCPVGLWVNHPRLPLEPLIRSLTGALPGPVIGLSLTQQDPLRTPNPGWGDNLESLDYVTSGHIRVAGSYEKFWLERPKGVRQQIERRLRRLLDMGIEPRLERVCEAGLMEECVRQFGELEVEGWKGRIGTAVHATNTQGAFYTTLLRAFAGLGQAHVYRFWFGDSLVAMELCVEAEGTIVFLKTAYDESFKKFSPGILMRHAIFRHIFEETPIQTIEFFGRLQPWQVDWISGKRTLFHVNYARWPSLIAAKRLLYSFAPRRGGEVAESTSVAVYEPDVGAIPHRYWDSETERSGRRIFSRLAWFETLALHALPEHSRIRSFAHEPADFPHVLVPMRHESAKRWWRPSRLVALGNFYTPVFGPVSPASGDVSRTAMAAIARTIRRDSMRWDVVDFHPLDVSESAWSAIGGGLADAGFLVQRYYCFGNWYLKVNGRSFEDYLAKLPSPLRNTLARKTRQLNARKDFRLDVITGTEGIDEAIAAYEAVYSASWKRVEAYPSFIRALVRLAADRGWLRMGIAYLDGRAVAAQIWLVDGRWAGIYKLAYDQSFAKMSVGSIVTAYLMRHVIDVDRVEEVDYLVGDDAYKKDWMSDRRELWGLVGYNFHTCWGLFEALRHFAGHHVWRRLAPRADDGNAGTGTVFAYHPGDRAL